MKAGVDLELRAPSESACSVRLDPQPLSNSVLGLLCKACCIMGRRCTNCVNETSFAVNRQPNARLADLSILDLLSGGEKTSC